MRDQSLSTLIYYSFLVAMILLNLLFLPFASGSDLRVTSGGITAVTMIFSFVLSLCAFKDSFLLNLQHGVSRRSQFLARMGAMATVAAVLAVADELYTLLVGLLSFAFPESFFAHSLYEICYTTDLWEDGSSFRYAVSTSPSSVVLSVVFSFFVLLAVCSFGYLIAVFNYRLNKLGKIIFWVGWPFLLVVGSAFLDANPQLANDLEPIVFKMVMACFSTLPRLCVTCTVLSVIFSALTWLLMRRASVK